MTRIVFPVSIAHQAETSFRASQRAAMLPWVVQIIDDYAAQYRPRKDASIPTDIRALLEAMEKSARGEKRLADIRRVASDIGRLFDNNNRVQVSGQVQNILGIYLGGISPSAQRELARYVDRNVDYIVKLGKTAKQQVREVVEKAFNTRDTPDRLQTLLLERVTIAENHAALIARDQGNKFFGALTRARHEDLGVTRYIWRTSADERVRDDHADREGQTFAYLEPPEDGNPGEPIQCRCTAEPIFDRIPEG